jgi:polyhydroxybutyrate depolymerase
MPTSSPVLEPVARPAPAPPRQPGRWARRGRQEVPDRGLTTPRLGLPLVVLAALGGVLGALLMPGRPLVPKGARASTRVITSGGLRRAELILQPARRSSTPLPLYVVLHGSDATPAFEERRTGLEALAGEGRAVVVYPTGVGGSWNAGQGCCGAAGASGVDDVGYIRDVIADAVETLGVSASAVYLVGYSNGGKLALLLADADPEQFAGVAVYGAVPLVPVSHGPPVPVMIAGGTADTRTPYEGAPSVQNGALAPSIIGTAEMLRTRDAADGPAVERPLAGGRVRISTWRGPSPRSVVQLVAYEGRDHAWPQRHDAPVALSELIESFFASLPHRS